MTAKRGYVLVAATVFVTVLVAFLGLATDVGFLQWQKIHAQIAADAAAQGAGLQLLDKNGSSSIISEGQTDASLNGFTQGTANTTVTVNNPPVQGSQAGNSSAVEVIVQRSVPTFFMRVLGSSTANLTARAVAVLGNNGGSGCIFVMDATANQAFTYSGGGTSYFPCSVEVASNNATSALSVGGGSTLYMKNKAAVDVIGGWSIGGGGQILNFNTGKNLTPQNITSLVDPLAYKKAPSASGLTLRSLSGVTYDSGHPPPGNTLQPGIYCGGLQVSSTAGTTFTMAKGVYYIAGGGFAFGGGATVTGTGVTIYNSSGPNSGVPGCNSAFQAFSISGSASVTLSAPTSGALEGMLIFQDRSINNSSNNAISGSSTSLLNGAIYLLHSPLQYTGGTASGYQILVTDTLTISGNATINSDYSTLQNGSPIRNAAILTE